MRFDCVSSLDALGAGGNTLKDKVKAPQITMVNQESKVDNRKDILVMWYKAVRDTNKNGTLDEQINSIINFINSATVDIPIKEYNPSRPYEIKPNYWKFRNEFIKKHQLLVPEFAIALEPEIQSMYKQEYLRRLQREMMIVQHKLHKATEWMFGEKSGVTYG
jgi:hypothetical protein